MPATRSNQVAAAVLAVLLPLAISGGAVLGLERARTAEDAQEHRNAGRVVNGKVVDVPVDRLIEDKLRQHEPDVVILGNSLANADLTPTLLARRLGLERGRVQRFAIPNSVGSHWYAILKNHVFANGHHPAVVLLLSDLQSALTVEPWSEAAYLNLRVHMTDDEPVLDALIARRGYGWERIRENRGRIRDQLLAGARNTVVDLLYRRTLESGRDAATERALARVFDDAQVDMTLHADVMPAFAQPGALGGVDPDALPAPEDSLMGPIAELCAEHGTVALFLRPPMAPGMPEGIGDRVRPEAEARAREVVAEAGGHVLDLRGMPMTNGHFSNLDHMNNAGARRLTEALAQALLELEGLPPRGPDTLELLSGIVLERGRMGLEVRETQFSSPPPPLPEPVRPFARSRTTRLLQLETADLAGLSDPRTLELTPFATRCSPVRVLEDGTPLPHPNRPCEEVRTLRRGRTCHTDEGVMFTSSDRTMPGRNGRTYTLALTEDRSCEGAVWLYPEDELTLELDGSEVLASLLGARSVRLEGRVMGPGSPDLQVRVAVNRVERTHARVPARALKAGASAALEPPLGRQAERVVVEVSNPSASFVLLTSVALSEAP